MKARGINENDIEATFIGDEIATAAEVKRIEMEKKKAEKGKKKAEKDKNKPEQEQIIDDEAVPVVYFPISTQFMVLGITEKNLDIQLSTNSSVQLRVPLEAVELWKPLVVEKKRKLEPEVIVQLPFPWSHPGTLWTCSRSLSPRPCTV